MTWSIHRSRRIDRIEPLREQKRTLGTSAQSQERSSSCRRIQRPLLTHLGGWESRSGRNGATAGRSGPAKLSNAPARGRRQLAPTRWAAEFLFEAEPLAAREHPHRGVIHLQPALRQLRRQAPQGEVGPHPLPQPIGVRALDSPRDMTPIARPRAARGPPAQSPFHHARRRDRQRLPRQSSLPKIHRIGSAHHCWPSHPSIDLESDPHRFGNPDSSKSLTQKPRYGQAA